MGFSCLKVVLLLFLLLEAIVSSSFALEFITGLFVSQFNNFAHLLS